MTHGYLAMTRTEFRLFRREPFSVVFVLAFPLMMMVLLAAVFGNNQADADKIQNGMLIWRGVTPANYYTAASVAVIVAALGLMTLPITLAGYRERGILRRFQASSVPSWVLVAAQLTVALVTFVAGTLVMAVAARLAYHAMLPKDVLGVAVGLLLGTAAFGAIGLLLATAIRTSRSAQGIGLLLFLALWLISGTAPPRAVLPAGLRDVGGVLPLSHLVTAVQNPWFGFGWSGTDLAVLAAYAVAAGLPALWLFSRSPARRTRRLSLTGRPTTRTHRALALAYEASARGDHLRTGGAIASSLLGPAAVAEDPVSDRAQAGSDGGEFVGGQDIDEQITDGVHVAGSDALDGGPAGVGEHGVDAARPAGAAAAARHSTMSTAMRLMAAHHSARRTL